MSKKTFVPIETWAFASPELRLDGIVVDLGLLAEALILFDQLAVNVQTDRQFAQIVESFHRDFGTVAPLIELFESGALTLHYYNFHSAPVKKDGILTYLNIEEAGTKDNPLLSFQQRILWTKELKNVLPRARHREPLYHAVAAHSVVDTASDYGPAIDAARESVAIDGEVQFFVQSFIDSLPPDYRKLFPDKISISTQKLENGLIQHRYNFDFDRLAPSLMGLGFGLHTPGSGLIQCYRTITTSQLHDLEIYVPPPLSSIIVEKMSSFSFENRRFQKTAVDLKEGASFPDIRAAFNKGELNWHDVLALRKSAKQFREWFNADGGHPELASNTYGEVFQKSTGWTDYKPKLFSITSFSTAVVGAGVGAAIGGPSGAVAGAAIGGISQLMKDLLCDSDSNWQPRFFGYWLNDEIKKRTENNRQAV